ncbi:DNA recombination protein RmuC [Candidatus Uhrbacteria bacterium]|nr:DNA recombination protein RmuC [Candidatus Uhrbacteria bacterium]
MEPLFIGIGIGLAGAGVLFFLFRSKTNVTNNSIENLVGRSVQEAVKNAQEQLLFVAKERLASDQEIARKELDHRKDSIERLVEEMRKDLTQNQERIRQSDARAIASFTGIQQELSMHKELMKDLRGTTDDLKNVLSNNQLRGSFGEQVAENLLRMAGFVIGNDYIVNREQERTETRPDFTIFLPDRTKINIDVKFPYAALVKLSSAQDAQEKDRYFKQFTQDVKQKIKQVTSRDYINPEDRTVDFVILFIPNEMIFSFIYDQLNEVWEEGMKQKVIFAGPFSFTAILRMVKQAYANFRYQENLHQVIGLIQKFETEYGKFSESLDLLGNRIEQVEKQYQAVSITRDRSLTRVIDKIKSQTEVVSEQSSNELISNP